MIIHIIPINSNMIGIISIFLYRDFIYNYLDEDFLAKNIIIHLISDKPNIIINFLERYLLKIFFLEIFSGFVWRRFFDEES